MIEEEQIVRPEEQQEELVEEKPENIVIDDNEELGKEMVGIFFDKSQLLDNSITIKPLQLSKGKWGRNLMFEVVDTGEEFLVDLNKTNYNWLLDNCGTTVKAWQEKNIVLNGEPFETTSARGELLKGIKIHFSKV